MTDERVQRVALVTGSSRGIGFDIAKALGQKGHHVIVNSRHPQELEASAKALRDMGIDATAVPFDVSHPSEIEAGFKQIVEKFGGVDILVNNAGIIADRSFRKMTLEDWKTVMDTNLNALFHCTKHSIEHMTGNGWGRIVNISSVVAQRGAFGQVNYATSKAGVIGFTKSLAREVARKGVTINAIAPGYIDTSMTAGIPEKVKDGIKAQIPFSDFGRPEDIANMVSYLCSEEARYVTGAVINVDGGY